MKEVIFNNEEYKEILQQINRLMEEVDALPYPNAKELMHDILKYFDSLHREPLSRMMDMLSHTHPELKQKWGADFTAKTMLQLYDLQVETQPQSRSDNGTIKQPLGFVPIEEVGILTPVKTKEWIELGLLKEFEEQKVYPKNFEKVNFLVSKVNQFVYAIQNQCVDSILPIDSGAIEDHFLICPWHGCRYDMKTGQAANHPDKKLIVYPVEIEQDGMIKVEIAY